MDELIEAEKLFGAAHESADGTFRPNVSAGPTMSWKATVLNIARHFDRKQHSQKSRPEGLAAEPTPNRDSCNSEDRMAALTHRCLQEASYRSGLLRKRLTAGDILSRLDAALRGEAV